MLEAQTRSCYLNNKMLYLAEGTSKMLISKGCKCFARFGRHVFDPQFWGVSNTCANRRIKLSIFYA
jgi:hypothetical protein